MINKRVEFIGAVLLLLIVCVFAVAQQQPELLVQTGHNDEIHALAYSPDGKLLASGGDDNTVRLWDVMSGSELRVLTGFKARVKRVVFSPDGRRLAGFSDQSRIIIVWNVATGAALYTFMTGEELIDSISFVSNARVLAARTLKKREPRAWTTRLRSWSLDNGRELEPVTTGVKPVDGYDRLISPNGRVEAYGYLFDERAPLTLRSVPGGTVLHELKGSYPISDAIAFSPDGEILAAQQTVNSRYVVKLWSVSTGRELNTYEVGAFNIINSITFSPDGKKLAAGIWDLTHWSGKILIWELASKESPKQLSQLAYQVNVIVASRDGRTIVSGGNDKRVNFWDVTTGALRSSINAHPVSIDSASFSPDGKTLVTSGGGQVKFWDVDSATEKTPPFKLPTEIGLVAFSPDGKILATSHSENSDRSGHKVSSPIYAPAAHQVRLWEVATGKPLLTIPTAEGTHTFRDVIAFSPDSKKVACAGHVVDNPVGEPRPSVDNVKAVIRVWDIEARKETQTLFGHPSGINSLAFSPDNKTLASGAFSEIMLWDLDNPKEPRTLANPSLVKALEFNQNGSLLISGDWDNSVKVWDVKTGDVLKTLRHSSPVEAVAFSADERVILSGGDDKKVTLWDTASGKELASVVATGQNDWQVKRRNDWLVATPDGLFDGSPDAWKQILWRFNNDTFDVSPVEIGYNEFYRPGLLADIITGNRPTATQDISKKDRRQPQLSLSLAGEQSPSAKPINNRVVRVSIKVAQVPSDSSKSLPPSGARDLRLFRNGSLVKLWKGNVLEGSEGCTGAEPGYAVCTTEVPIIEGENRFTAYAFNYQNMKSADVELTLTGSDSLRRKGTLYVLAMGVNEYANKKFNLRYAVPDALEFSAVLKLQQDKLKNYEPAKILPLYNEQAEKKNILAALAELATKIQPEDALVVYFAGHGTVGSCQINSAQTVNAKDRFYLVPYDLGYGGSIPKQCDQQMLNEVTKNSISDEELEAAFVSIDAGQILLVIDACNSGQALESEEKRRGPMNSKGLAQLAYEKGMYILTAAQSFQEAKADKKIAKGHGYLTYALVEEALKSNVADTNQDRQVDLREWVNYAVQRVPQMQQTEAQERRRLIKRGGQEVSDEDTQQPRVFYRREVDIKPLIVAKP